MTTAPRPRGRPAVGERVEVRLPADVLAEVDYLAEVDGKKRAEMLRELVEWGLRRNRAARKTLPPDA